MPARGISIVPYGYSVGAGNVAGRQVSNESMMIANPNMVPKCNRNYCGRGKLGAYGIEGGSAAPLRLYISFSLCWSVITAGKEMSLVRGLL